MEISEWSFCVGSSFFCVKQKTAYEMRISDWSSDVCSSELRDIGNGGVFGFSGAMRHNGRIARALGHLDGGEGFGQGSDLVDLDQYGIGHAKLDASLENLGIGYEQIVAHQLNPFAQLIGQDFPAVPVVFRSEEQKSELQSLIRNSYA